MASAFCRVADVSCLETDRRGAACQRDGIFITDEASALKSREFDLVIVAVKCFDIERVFQAVRGSFKARAVLFLQNGQFPLAGAVKCFPGAAILRGVTTVAVEAGVSGSFKTHACGRIYMGVHAGGRARLNAAADLLRKAGESVSCVSDPRSAVWAKLIFSAVMNPLPIVVDDDYRIIQKDSRIFAMVVAGINEGKAVARRMGVPLAFDPLSIVRRLKRSRGNGFVYRGSMHRDLVMGRPLELDHITGEVMRCGRKLGVKTPVLDTLFTITYALERCRDAA
jgi:2-dehydropantoate 2-reductase